MSAPLLKRPLHTAIAWLRAAQPNLGLQAGPVDTRIFLAQVKKLATLLPSGTYAINLCGNRYTFLLAFCALLLREQTNLLPPNRNVQTQNRLAERYLNTYIIHDGVECEQSLPAINIQELDLRVGQEVLSEICVVPKVRLNHIAAIAFTSGSTGDSKPNIKSWHTFVESTQINISNMLPHTSETLFMLATVPGQHMWGMETSILIPLFADIAALDSKPLFPKDVQSHLQNLPENRILVSTPVHLRALQLSGLHFEKLTRLLCATAPLSRELARELEALFKTELREVFGCSEVGSMAWRRTAITDYWQKFEGIALVASEEGAVASAEHLPETIVLQDFLSFKNDKEFKLSGRHSDLIEIAGKRGSLKELNDVLLKIDNVVDAAVFLIEDNPKVNRTSALVVLKQGAEDDMRKIIQAQFREYFDPVFVPRPIYFVPALPREENGKLQKTKLLDLYAQLK